MSLGGDYLICLLVSLLNMKHFQLYFYSVWWEENETESYRIWFVSNFAAKYLCHLDEVAWRYHPLWLVSSHTENLKISEVSFST